MPKFEQYRVVLLLIIFMFPCSSKEIKASGILKPFSSKPPNNPKNPSGVKKIEIPTANDVPPSSSILVSSLWHRSFDAYDCCRLCLAHGRLYSAVSLCDVWCITHFWETLRRVNGPLFQRRVVYEIWMVHWFLDGFSPVWWHNNLVSDPHVVRFKLFASEL